MQRTIAKSVSRIPKIVLTVVIMVWVLTPIYFLVATALTRDGSYLDGFSLPPEPTLANFSQIVSGANAIWQPLINSTIVTVATTLLALLMAAPAAWALSHYRDARVGRFTYYAVFVLRGIPAVSLVLPFYLIFSRMRLLDSLFGMVIALAPLALPFCIWNLRVAFDAIPVAVEESASVDGAGLLRTFVQIVVPIAAPAIAATGTLSALFTYVDFIIVATLAGPSTWTFPVYVTGFQQDFVTLVGPLAAASVVGVLPMIVLFGFSQRHMRRLVAAGIH